MPHKVLIVEDEAIAALSLKESLQQMGFAVTDLASTGEEALTSVEEEMPDLVLMDINLEEEQDGISIGKRLMQDYQLPVVFLTAYSDRATIDRAREVFPYGYMIKPWQEAELLAVIETAIFKNLADKRQQELQQTRIKFYSIIGHDLRSPLAALSVSTRALLKHLNNLSKEDIREFVADIHATVENLYEFTDNLLEWSRVQSGRLEYRPEKILLAPVVSEAIQLLAKSAQAKEVTLQQELAPAVGVIADKNMLRSILLNLLSNGLKFSYPGSTVLVSAQTAGEEVVVSVSDKGRGMPAEQLNSLFDFKKAIHTPGTQEEKGTGLGLLLTKEFVEAHGGQLEVISREHEGTQVNFTLFGAT